MLKYLNFNNGYFIEMGAHDGIHNSNTYYYEKNKNWTGILIEPSFNYKFLIKNRSNKNKFLILVVQNLMKNDTLFLNSDDYSICKDLVDQDYLKWHLNKQIQSNKKMQKQILN